MLFPPTKFCHILTETQTKAKAVSKKKKLNIKEENCQFIKYQDFFFYCLEYYSFQHLP